MTNNNTRFCLCGEPLVRRKKEALADFNIRRHCNNSCRLRYGKPNGFTFWNYVTKTSECWLWEGPLNATGYGYLYIKKGVSMLAHRHSWMLANGPIRLGLCVLHKCDNPRCVNPDHLFLGTRKDNVRDMHEKGRNRVMRGSENSSAILDEEKVKAIRAKYIAGGETFVTLAAEYGVCPSTISHIMNGRSWRHIGHQNEPKPETKTIYRLFDQMAWPSPCEKMNELERRLRHTPGEISQSDRLSAAAIISAYTALVGKSRREISKLVTELKNGPNV